MQIHQFEVGSLKARLSSQKIYAYIHVYIYYMCMYIYIYIHIPFQCITFHYIALHCIVLHCITPHDDNTIHYITLHCTTISYIVLHYMTWTLHYTTYTSVIICVHIFFFIALCSRPFQVASMQNTGLKSCYSRPMKELVLQFNALVAYSTNSKIFVG